jgi:hypothetical protein
MQRTYQPAGRHQGGIQRSCVRQRVGVVDDDRSQGRAFPVIRRDPVEMRFADRHRRRPTAQIGRVQRSDGRLLDRK